MRRTNLQLISDFLADQPNQQASARQIAAGLGWDLEKVKRIIAIANDDATEAIHIGHGGVVQFRGTEKGPSVGLYHDVRRVLEGKWAAHHTLRNPVTHVCAHSGRRGAGTWLHPDLVVEALPPRRKSADDPPDLHVFEVEKVDGFDIRSVYQADACAYGANFAWVIFHERALSDPSWTRVKATAGRLGVGLISFSWPGNWTTWTHHLNASRRPHSPELRKQFQATVLTDQQSG